MLSVKKLLSSDSGSLFISILLGLGLASVFRKVCNDRSCLIIQKIPVENLKDKTLRKNGRCYRWVPETVACQNSTQKKRD